MTFVLASWVVVDVISHEDGVDANHDDHDGGNVNNHDDHDDGGNVEK